MEATRQKALEMKDELVQDFQQIRNNFPDDFGEGKPTALVSTFKKPSWVFEQQGKEWLQQVDILLKHLMNDVEDTDVSFEEIVDEMYIILKTTNRNGEPAIINITACSKEAFAFYIARECLYYEKLNIVFSDTWKGFSKNFANYVMAI